MEEFKVLSIEALEVLLRPGNNNDGYIVDNLRERRRAEMSSLMNYLKEKGLIQENRFFVLGDNSLGYMATLTQTGREVYKSVRAVADALLEPVIPLPLLHGEVVEGLKYASGLRNKRPPREFFEGFWDD